MIYLGELVDPLRAGRGGYEVNTDARGDYDVCIPGWRGNPARRTLLARADGYAAAEVLAPDASGRVDFSLSPEAVVSGQVVAPPGNRPVPGAKVSMTPARYQPVTETPRSTEFQLMTDAEGRFEFRNLPADRYRGAVEHDSYGLRWGKPMVVNAGELVTGLALETRRVSIVRGVVTRDGRPVPWSPVWIRGRNEDLGRVFAEYTKTDGQGAFRMRLVEMVADDIRVYPDGGKAVIPTPSTFLVGGSSVDGVHLVLPPVGLDESPANRSRH